MGNCTTSEDTKAEQISVPEPTIVEDEPVTVEPYIPIHSAFRWNKVDLKTIKDEDLAIENPTNGNRPIHIAVQNGHTQLVDYLISKNVNINAQNNCGNTPMHMAVQFDIFNLYQKLLNAGADPNIKNTSGHISSSGFGGDRTIPLLKFRAARTKNEIEDALKSISDDFENTLSYVFENSIMVVKSKIEVDLWTSEFEETSKKILENLREFEDKKASQAQAPTQKLSNWDLSTSTQLFCFAQT